MNTTSTTATTGMLTMMLNDTKMTDIEQYYRILKNQTTNQLGLYLFCCSLSIIWTVYIMFFNSRISGILATFLANLYLKRYHKNVWLKIGSLSISILSGKVMFRSVHYVTLDYMLYIQDGYLQFAFWRPQYIKEEQLVNTTVQKDQPTPSNDTETSNVTSTPTSFKKIIKKKIARLEIMLNNLQIHYYNSWKQFETQISTAYQTNGSTVTTTTTTTAADGSGDMFKEHLMYLFSIVNLRIQKGRIYFGNNSTLNSILAIKFSNSKMELVTETSQSKVDDFCYILSGDITKLEIAFLVVKSNAANQFKLFNLNGNGETKKPKYENRMLILRSGACDFKYIQDIPTILTFDRRRVLKNNNGEFVHDNQEPQWSLIVNCSKSPNGQQGSSNFVLNYGPWYDRQREELWKYFFPQTYEILEPQASPKLNERRQISKFDFVLNLKEGSNAEVNLIFCSNKSDNNIQDRKLTFRCRSDSTFTCSIPWLTKKHGYQTNICGTFNSVQSYTNMSFKHFLCAEQVKLNLEIHYPLIWNDMQKWDIDLDLYRASLFLIFQHKYFFQDLINDWSSKTIADLRSFVPYVYNINANVVDLELLLPSNQHNWIDTNFIENNAYLALLAPTALIKTSFLFEDFLQEKSKIKLDIKAGEVCARFIVPETNTHLILLKLLRKNLKFYSNDGIKTEFNSKRWTKFDSSVDYYLNDYDKKGYSQHLKENWFEWGQSDKVEVTLTYTYHPCPLINWSDGDVIDEATGVKKFDAEQCQTPTAAFLKQLKPDSKEFDCEIFKPDVISVQVEIGPCNLLVYGTFLKRLWYVKEAYFSWDQFYSEIKNTFEQKEYNDVSPLADCDRNDGRNFRPLSIDLILAIHNIHGHLVLDSSGDPFPIGFTDRLCVELDKNYKETRLQLYVDPINLFLFDSVKRKYDKNLKQGQLCLSSLQVRGHAMFSDVGRIKTDTLEYAWLLEILLGDVSGYLTPVQSEQVIHFLETFLNLILENEYDLKPVFANRVDPGLPYKYCVTKFSLDSVDIYLAESGTALNIQLYPVRLSMCNSHTSEYAKGLSVYIHEIKLKQYLNEANRNFNNSLNDTLTNDTTTRSESQLSQNHGKPADTTKTDRRDSDASTVTISSLSSSCSSLFSVFNSKRKDALTKTKNNQTETVLNPDSHATTPHIPDSNEFNFWFECFSFQTGPIMLDMQLEKGDTAEQMKFLRLHDEDTKRLYFLWDSYYDYDLKEHVAKSKVGNKCGCIGGCYFYSVGNNEHYFKSTKALTKTGNYAKSLFNAKFHVLQSHKIMRDKYSTNEQYKYQLLDDRNCGFIIEMPIQQQQQQQNLQQPIIQQKQQQQRPSNSNSNNKLSQKSVGKSLDSLRMMNRVNSSLTNNEDYFTADEDDDGDDRSLQNARRESRKFLKSNSVISTRTASSVSSFVSVNETTLNGNGNGNASDDEEEEQVTVLERPGDLKLNVNLNKSLNDTDEEDGDDEDDNASVIINDDEDIDLNMAAQNSKLTLKFDIQKPILESVLPKYCYLKHLSRANVKNWNLISRFPLFNEFKQNINFTPIQAGFNCSLLKKNPLLSTNSTTGTSSNPPPTTTTASERPTTVLQTSNDDVKCRVNLCFTNAIECYTTPLILTCLERYVKALKAYKLNPHTLLTEVDAKSQANCASDSLIEVISRTQISLNIPEIRLCSLQVGLAEDKTNMLIDTLVHPDELVTLSLFTICIHNIETQLSDSRNLKAAIFKINKIDTQFRRLHTDINKQDQQQHQPIKLSCITNERSKVSFQCFNQSNDILVSKSPGSIMYECAFEEISIKAVKKFHSNETSGDDSDKDSVASVASSSTLTSTGTGHSHRTLINHGSDSEDECIPPTTTLEGDDNQTHNNNNGRISLCEFDISKIWFSFPEPSISPKGKRKIPYNRYEWNFLSSVSPAVISWLCASKHVTKPFKQYLNKHNKHLLQTLAALLTGSLKHSNELQAMLNNAKLTSQYQKNNFLNYLTNSSLLYNKDINCRLVKLLRLYLLHYSNDLQSDLACKQIPDIKNLKRGINEVLNCWSNILLGPACEQHNGAHEKYRYITEIRQFDRQHHQAPNETLFRRHSSTLTTQNVNFINQSVSYSKMNHSQLRANLLSPFTATLSSSNQSSGDESNFDIGNSSILHQTKQQSPMKSAPGQTLNDSTLNFNVNNGKTETVLNNTIQQNQQQQQNQKNSKKLHSGHVGPILNTNINRLFKPVLNFIGIDVPSGTLVDNLFKEFGSCLIGNLNIKSVDINILGTVKKTNENLFYNEHNQFIKFRKVPTPVGGPKTSLQSSVTTILSFDSLLLNINVRQVLPTESIENQAEVQPLNLKRKSTIRTIRSLNNGALARLPKYYTKIDTSIKLNNLTQEVNMPLLRLAHQLYSIIADGIEYDKEQFDQTIVNGDHSVNNSYNELTRKVDSKMKQHYDMDYEYNSEDDDEDDEEDKKEQLQTQPSKRKHQYQPSNQSISKDCWTYMDSVLKLRDFIPEPKFIEKISEIDKDALKKPKQQKFFHITKNAPESESNLVSLFGWININQINSRAGIGTLTYSGEMKNVQLSVMFGKKFQGVVSSKKHYEGSLNLRMDSTSGKLTENDENIVAKMNVGKSHTFCYLKKVNLKHLISSFVHIGKINIDVPLRPMDVHSVVYRESKVIEQKILPEFKDFVMFDSIAQQTASSQNQQQQTGQGGASTGVPGGIPSFYTSADFVKGHFDDTSSQATTLTNEMGSKLNKKSRMNSRMKRNMSNNSLKNANTAQQQQQQQQQQLNRFYFNLKSKFDGVDIRAKLLEKPCLKAAYIMNNIEFIASLNGGKSKLTCILYEHRLSFESDNLDSATTPTTNPSTSTTAANAFLSHSLSHATFKQNHQQQQKDEENTTLTNFDLPGIEIIGIYNSRLNTIETDAATASKTQQHHQRQHRSQHLPATNIKQQIVDIQLNVKVSELTRELDADVIAQLVFVTKIFIKEINYILQAIYNLDNFNPKSSQQQQQQIPKPPPPPPTSTSTAIADTPTAKIFYDIHIDIGKIVLTAITPTFTSLSICTGEKNIAYLTNNFLNNNKYFTNEYTLKPSVEAKCNICVDLKTCFSKQNEFKFNTRQTTADDYEQKKQDSKQQQQQSQQEDEQSSNEDDWYKLASFDTKIDLKNAIRILSKEHDREAIIITVENPRFYLQPGAVDNAILFWLNYKSTYESWLSKRQQFAALFNADNNNAQPVAAAAPPPPTNPKAQHQQKHNSNNNSNSNSNNANSNFLALKLRVTSLGLALPLSNKLTKDFKTNTDCLVITLNDTSIYACSSGCVVSKGQFSNFCLRFAENFNLASSDWMPVVTPFVINKNESIYLNTLLNAWLVPSGSYEVCSSTIQNLIESNQNKTKLNRPLWILSVKWKMEGIDVNLDTTIGKWLSKLTSTVTRLAETQYAYEDSNHDQSRNTELRKLKNELQYYKECGDSVNANLVQLKIDRLSLASYPEKAKKILAKTRNNLKGQFGFNTTATTNQTTNASTNTFQQPSSLPTQQQQPTAVTTSLEVGSARRHLSAKITKEETELINQASTNSSHLRSKSGDINIRRSHKRTKSEPFARIFSSFLKSLSKEESSLDSINESKSTLNSCPATPLSNKSTPSHDLKNKDNYKNQCVLEENESEASSSREHLNKSSLPKLIPIASAAANASSAAPAIDFKLDVQIEISSGKCVLHASKPPPPPPQQQQQQPQQPQQQQNQQQTHKTTLNTSTTNIQHPVNQQSNQQGFFNPMYRYSHLGNDEQTQGSGSIFDEIQSQARMAIINEHQQYYQRYQLYQQQNSNKITNFIFPAIRVKAHYESTYREINKRLFKKANLYSVIKLESFVLPQTYMLQSDYFKTKDMCIGPQLLDFLEHTLEPFNLSTKSHHKNEQNHHMDQVTDDDDDDEIDDDIFEETDQFDQDHKYNPQRSHHRQRSQHYTEANNGSANENNTNGGIIVSSAAIKNNQQAQAYFPVDVIVIVSMLPSSVRFTCAPQSTMDCLLKLPTIELVFSTKSLSSNQLMQNGETPDSLFGPKSSPTKPSTPKLAEMNSNNDNAGGLSVSCCMTDFSLKFYNRLGKQGPSESRYLYSETRHSLEDKDSLSVRVEFIKVNISRSRRLLNQVNNNEKFNDVKLSVLADIGRASFIYDMRNIKEVFVFPKIWYRRSLARRLFLGEEPTSAFSNLNSNRNSQSPPPPSAFAQTVNIPHSSPQDDLSIFTGSLTQNRGKNSDLHGKRKRQQQQQQQHHHNEINFLHNGSLNWQTLVLVSINLSELEVRMNVGDVLGHVAWITRNARSSSKISISSFGPRKMQFNFVLDSSRLVADGGQTRCMVRVQDISSFVEMNDEDKSLTKIQKSTFNKVDLNVFAMEIRVDNMYDRGSPILACRLSNLNARLNDLWEPRTVDEIKPNTIFVELHIAWDQFHLMITRSTTPDLIVFYYKLADYIKKQFTESKDYIKECDLDLFYEMKLKQQFMEQKEVLLKKHFNVPGGGIFIKGNNFTIVTFHGANFKAAKWALFSLNEPSLDLTTDALVTKKGEPEGKTHDLYFFLGRDKIDKTNQNMASIYMVYRESALVTAYETINQWFEYAHQGIDAVGLRDFPRFTLDQDHPDIIKKVKIVEQIKSEELFHLPGLQIYFKSNIVKDRVEFVFETEFYHHILTTFSTQHLHFLYELIKGYIKEKEVIRNKEDCIPPTKIDERVYDCAKWTLSPTLKLISKVGSVDSFGVDTLLKNLGLNHAKTTIPKYIQRGLMDNADELIEKIIAVYLKMLPDCPETTTTNR